MSPRRLAPGGRARFAIVSLALALVPGSALLATPAHASTTITWNNAAGGLWSDPANWSPANVPDSPGEAAVLPTLSGAYAVTLDINPAVDRLDVQASDPTLDLNGHSIAGIGLVENYGTILNFLGAYQSARLHNRTGGLISAAYNGVVTATDSLELFGGTLSVGPGPSSKLVTPGNFKLVGTGTVLLDHSTLYDPAGDVGSWLTIRSGVTLAGSGYINKRIQSSGTIANDGPAVLLKIDGVVVNNGGTVRIQGGGLLQINRPLFQNFGLTTSGPGGGTLSLRLDSGNLGTIDLHYGGRLVVNGGDLNVSCLTAYNGSIGRVGETGALNIDIGTLQDMEIETGAEVAVTDHIDFMAAHQTLVNNGLLRVLGSIHFGLLNSPDSIWIAGTGVVRLEGGRLGSGVGGYLVNASGMRIEGCGTILPPFVNEGVVDIECAPTIGPDPGVWINGNLLRVHGGRFKVTGAQGRLVNLGRIEVDGQLVVEKGGTIDNTRGVIRTGRGDVLLGNTDTYGIIRGGRLEGAGNGKFYAWQRGVLEDVTLGSTGTLVVPKGALARVTGRRFLNEGTVRVQGTGRLQASLPTMYVQTGGATSLEGGTLASDRVIQIEGGEVRGSGTVAGMLASGGVVRPDVGPSGLRVEGSYVQLPNGTLDVGIAGPAATQVAKLDVLGHVQLDGNLQPTLVGGYAPGTGLLFEVLRFGTLSGGFANLNGLTSEVSAPLFTPYISASAFSLVTGGTTGVGDPPREVAELRFSGRSSPRGARLVLELPQAAEVDGRIFDAGGRQIAQFARGEMPAGVHEFAVRGDREALPAGVYFARVGIQGAANHEVRTAKVVVLR